MARNETQEEYVERIKTEILAYAFNVARLELNRSYIDKDGIMNKLCANDADRMKELFVDNIKGLAKDIIISTIV